MPPLQTVQAIFFDIGDTLVYDDPPLPQRFAQAAETLGLTLDPVLLPSAWRTGEEYAVRQYVQGVPWDAPDSMREASARIWSALGMPPAGDAQWAAFQKAFAAVPFTRAVHRDTLPLLRDLKARGFILGAISDWEETLPGLLVELGIAPFLDALAVSAIVGAAKPHPRLFEDALRQTQIPAERSLHIGDWYELDVAGARSAGMQPLLLDQTGRRPQADCPRVTSFEALVADLQALPPPEEN